MCCSCSRRARSGLAFLRSLAQSSSVRLGVPLGLRRGAIARAMLCSFSALERGLLLDLGLDGSVNLVGLGRRVRVVLELKVLADGLDGAGDLLFGPGVQDGAVGGGEDAPLAHTDSPSSARGCGHRACACGSAHCPLARW